MCIVESTHKKSDDFEIRKKEDSIQTKRHYRSNKADSTDSESDRGRDRRTKKVIEINFVFKLLIEYNLILINSKNDIRMYFFFFYI